MKVVILKQNTDIISNYDPKIKFKPAPEPWTDRFCAFTVQRGTFNNIQRYLRAKGMNPYAMLSW